MDIVVRLRGHAKSNAGGARELLVLSADEIERLRLSLMTFADNVKETNAGIDKNWAETVYPLKANNERLRQQVEDLALVARGAAYRIEDAKKSQRFLAMIDKAVGGK